MFTKPETKSGSSKIIIEATFIGRSTANKSIARNLGGQSYSQHLLSIIFHHRLDRFIIRFCFKRKISFL